MVGGNAHGQPQLAVGGKVLVLAVDRHEVARVHQPLHELQLLLAGVTRHVHLDRGIVDDLHVHLGKLIDDASDQLLVAGNGGGGQHDQVGGTQRDLIMIPERHAVECRHRLALTARGDKRQLIRAVLADLGNVDQHASRHLHVAQLHGGGNDIDHAPPRDGDLAPVAGADVNDLLDAVDVGGEGGNDDALLRVHGEDHLQRLAHLLLGGGMPGALGVGGLAHQHQHAVPSQLAQPGDVHHVAVDRRQIQLEVAGVHHRAHPGMDGESH